MTATLCAISGCRLRGQHLPACGVEGCGGCLPRAAYEGHACGSCVDRARSRLITIAGLAPDARAVAAGLVRLGAVGGGGHGKPGSRPPINLGATDTLHAIQNALTAIARDIAETRGSQFVSTAFDGHEAPDPLAEAAMWLTGSLEWVRHAIDDQGNPYAVTVFAEIGECASRIRGIVNGPAAQRYLGPCGAPARINACPSTPPGGTCRVWIQAGGTRICPDGECADEPDPTCDGDVYGRVGAHVGHCRACGAGVDQDERRAWLDDEVRQHVFRAAHIADAYRVNVKTIRSWHLRGRLANHGHDDAGRPLFNVGEVLDLATEDADRRETERAKRERRAAARADEDAA